MFIRVRALYYDHVAMKKRGKNARTFFTRRFESMELLSLD